jgi:hypothetical protein
LQVFKGTKNPLLELPVFQGKGSTICEKPDRVALISIHGLV